MVAHRRFVNGGGGRVVNLDAVGDCVSDLDRGAVSRLRYLERRVLEHRDVQGVGREARDVNGALGEFKAPVLRDGLAVERAHGEREEAGGVGRGRDGRLDEARAVPSGGDVEEVARGRLRRAELRGREHEAEAPRGVGGEGVRVVEVRV